MEARSGLPTVDCGLSTEESRRRRVVHLPVYSVNPYQRILMEAQGALGWDVIHGGSGGNFARTALRNWKADVLHFHWLHPYLLRSGRLATMVRANRLLAELRLIKATGTKIAWTVHNLKNHANISIDSEVKYSRRFAALCDVIFTHGKVANELARQQFQIADSTAVIDTPLPSYKEFYSGDPTKAEARMTLGLPENARIATYLGRVEPYKQILELLDAFRSVESQNCRLVIVGGCSNAQYQEQIEAKAAFDARVQLRLEHVPDELVAHYIRSADIIACPSREVLTSSSVSLAMSFGRPALAPADGCIPETVGDTGFLYDNTQENSLRDMLNQAMRVDSFHLDQFGLNAAQKMENATPKNVARRILKGYESVLTSVKCAKSLHQKKRY